MGIDYKILSVEFVMLLGLVIGFIDQINTILQFVGLVISLSIGMIKLYNYYQEHKKKKDVKAP